VLFFVVLPALLASSCVSSQSQCGNRKILSALADNNHVETISVGSFGMWIVKLFGAFDEVPQLKGIKSCEIMTISNECPEHKRADIKKQMSNLKDDGEFSTLMQVKDKDDLVRMLIRKENDIIKEFLLVVVSGNDDDSTVIRIKGNMSEPDLSQLVEKAKAKKKTKKQ
jgi:hypothetical protein